MKFIPTRGWAGAKEAFLSCFHCNRNNWSTSTTNTARVVHNTFHNKIIAWLLWINKTKGKTFLFYYAKDIIAIIIIVESRVESREFVSMVGNDRHLNNKVMIFFSIHTPHFLMGFVKSLSFSCRLGSEKMFLFAS